MIYILLSNIKKMYIKYSYCGHNHFYVILAFSYLVITFLYCINKVRKLKKYKATHFTIIDKTTNQSSNIKC